MDGCYFMCILRTFYVSLVIPSRNFINLMHQVVRTPASSMFFLLACEDTFRLDQVEVGCYACL